MANPNSPGVSAEENSNAPEENLSTADLAAQVSALTAERDQVAAEKAELQDLVLRRQADFDNFRRRSERDRSEFVQYAGMEFVREVLPVLDDFERAMNANTVSNDYSKGIELIYQRMVDALKKMGLEPIETVGKTFDPHVHQAVEKVQSEDAEDHSVLGEYQKGYHFKGKLLRPSMVKVAVRS